MVSTRSHTTKPIASETCRDQTVSWNDTRAVTPHATRPIRRCMLAKTNGRLWLAASKSRAVVGSSLAMPPLKSNSHRAINCKHCSGFREHSLKCDNRHYQCQSVIVLAINLSCGNPTNEKSCTRLVIFLFSNAMLHQSQGGQNFSPSQLIATGKARTKRSHQEIAANKRWIA